MPRIASGGCEAGRVFEQTLIVGWAQTDFNAHLRNSAYLDMCSDVRMLYFEANGFSTSGFDGQRFGPVVRTDSLQYFREVHLLDRVRVTLRAAGQSEDGSRWRLQNDFYRPDGELSATVISNGGWLSLEDRKLRVPPPPILDAMNRLVRTDDYEVLPGRRR